MKYRLEGAEVDVQPTKTIDRYIDEAMEANKAPAEII